MLVSDLRKDIHLFRVVLLVRVTPFLVMRFDADEVSKQHLEASLARMPGNTRLSAEFTSHDTLEIGV